MNIYLDSEFTGLHRNTTLISIGLVNENGDTFYAEFTDYDKSQVDEWIQKNVIDNLILSKWDTEKDYSPYEKHVTCKGRRYEVEQALSHWLFKHEPERIEIWSDVLAYDWMLFCDLWGGAFKIPPFINYIPFDLATLLKEKSIDPDINREKFAYGDQVPEGMLKHNALWDAKTIKACVEKAEKINNVK